METLLHHDHYDPRFLEDPPPPFFSLACRATSPFLVQCAGKVTAVRALIDEKQGREIVMVYARLSNWGRAGGDRESEWVPIRHQRLVLRFGLGKNSRDRRGW